MTCRLAAAALLVTAAALVYGSTVRAPDGAVGRRTRDVRTVWVLLDTLAARGNGPPALGARAIERRLRSGIPIPPGDRPIPDSLLDRIAATGARIRYPSRWLRAVSVDTDAAGLRRLLGLPFVRGIRPVQRLQPAAAGVARVDQLERKNPVPVRSAQAFDSAYYGANWSAIRRLGIPPAHLYGFTGSGVRIAILDTGFEPAHRSFAGSTIHAARDFINGDAVVSDQPGESGVDQEVHGTRVWSLIASKLPGTLVGVAPDAEFILAKVDEEPGDTGVDEDRWVAAVEWADSLGAHIINSSVVYRFDFRDREPYPFDVMDGDQTVTTRMADEAARRGILVVAAMGDDGPELGTLSAPADADSVIAVGALTALGQVATFRQGASARGPAADGRTKPELAAQGVNLVTASSESPDALATGVEGTSFATALVSGAAALVMSAWPDLSAKAVRDALLLAAEQRVPDNAMGHGRPDVAAVILAPSGITDMRAATINLQSMLTTIAPTFSWRAPLLHPDIHPVRYRVEVARDPVFDDIVYTDTVTDAFSLQVRQAIKPAPALWWRVIAEAEGGVRRFSPVPSPISMPGWVRLLSPPGDRVTFIESQRPELSWSPLTAPAPIGPFVYDVEIFNVADGRLAQPAIRNLSQATVRLPQPLTPNNAYRWRVIARTQLGLADTVESSAPFVVTSDTLPPATLLYQNFPNPFPRRDLGMLDTRIWFDLAAESEVELAVFDLRGRLVRRLIPDSPSCGPVTLEPGQYGRLAPGAQPGPCVSTRWDGRDENGEVVPRGVYVLRLRADGKVEYRRMIFLPDGS